MPKHRSKGVKREHTILEDFEGPLKKVANLEGVKSVIPGEISRRSGSGHKRITFQYPTKSGAKLLAKRANAVQEVFVVCQKPDKVKDFVKDLRI